MTQERREQTTIDVWRHEQRASFDALRKEKFFSRIEPPEGWAEKDGKLLFDVPKEFPQAYRAEQLQTQRGTHHPEEELIDWRGDRSLNLTLLDLTRRGSLHPVSFKWLQLPALKEYLARGEERRFLVLPGVVGKFSQQLVHPIICHTNPTLPEEGRVLRFYAPDRLVEVARQYPTALFFTHTKKALRQDV